MRTGICILFVSLILATNAAMAFYGRINHGTANADASRRALSDSIELEDNGGKIGYAVFARRDQIISDRTNTNALGIAVLPVRFPGHEFRFGLGAHFHQQALVSRRAEPGSFSPAGLIGWNAESFRLEVAGGEKFLRAAAALLFDFAVPIEFGSDFEQAFSQPYRWSVNAYGHLMRYGGLIAGYEPLSARARTGFWLKPVEGLQISTIARLSTGTTAEWEFALSYQFTAPPGEAHSAPTTKIKGPEHKRERKSPAFATLVKWGLTPVEALRFTREKDACSLGAASQAILNKHHWECRRGS
ncbi:MAG: hypothetical protein U1F16_01320 [Turneriella sp.]